MKHTIKSRNQSKCIQLYSKKQETFQNGIENMDYIVVCDGKAGQPPQKKKLGFISLPTVNLKLIKDLSVRNETIKQMKS